MLASRRTLLRCYSTKGGPKPPAQMVSSRVPSSQLERIYHYGQLATGMGVGALAEGLKRLTGSGSAGGGSVFLSEANLDRMVRKLSRMRGAALKIGQLVSFQDETIIPKGIQEVLRRLQSRANYMPMRQLEQVMSAEMGPEWRQKFGTFNDKPIAAASIGQVHEGTLPDGQKVAIKVQYPGVANSIDSDLDTLGLLLLGSRMLPEGLYLDKTIANAREELAWECDYEREAAAMRHFSDLIKPYPEYVAPRVHADHSGKHVLTMDFMEGTEISKCPPEDGDKIAAAVMKMCLLEIGKFHYMQTDPNWANFLLNHDTQKIELLDFGASRGYDEKFINAYLEVLRAAVKVDRKAIEHWSRELGYLTGLESPAMREAHIDSILILGEPFRSPSYDFNNQTVTKRVRGNIGLMLRERLTPPPEETYGLHRKLSGAFLLCSRLGAKVPTGDYFREIIGGV